MTRDPKSPYGKPAEAIAAAYQASCDAASLVTACAFCDWNYEGTAAEGRARALQHRTEHHPEARQTRRRKGHLQRWRISDDSFRDEGLENAAAVAKMHQRREGRAA